MAARRNKYKSFLLLRFLISLYHKSHIFLHPHRVTKVVLMLTGAASKYCGKQIVNNASTNMMSFAWLPLFLFFFPHIVSYIVKSLNV